jgi:hypothetical protein
MSYGESSRAEELKIEAQEKKQKGNIKICFFFPLKITQTLD